MHNSAMPQTPLIPNAADPIALFGQWFAEAGAKEGVLPEAMNLATATRNGKPSSRMVLLKDVDARGFVFYTNAQSRKGLEIAANAAAALCFHWKFLRRQVRVEGTLTEVAEGEADAYWASRPRESQIAGWASQQSQALASRTALEGRVSEFAAQFAGAPVPRPPQWTGFRLAPDEIEFWQDIPNRLHDRLVFSRDGASWRTTRLYP